VHIFSLCNEDLGDEGSIITTDNAPAISKVKTDDSSATINASTKQSDSSIDLSFVKISVPPEGTVSDAGSGGYYNNDYNPKVVLHNMTQRTMSALSNFAAASGLSSVLSGNSQTGTAGTCQAKTSHPFVGTAVSQLGWLGNKAQREIVEEQLLLQRARYMATVPGILENKGLEQGQGKEFTVCLKYCDQTESNPRGDLKLLVVTKLGYFYRCFESRYIYIFFSIVTCLHNDW
jgi:hypothetical protein